MVFIKCPKQGITLLLGLGRVMKYFFKFQKICYGAQCIFRIPCKMVDVLNNFDHEQYPSNNIDPQCLIIEYNYNGFHKATQYLSTCQKICYGTQCIFGIP